MTKVTLAMPVGTSTEQFLANLQRFIDEDKEWDVEEITVNIDGVRHTLTKTKGASNEPNTRGDGDGGTTARPAG